MLKASIRVNPPRKLMHCRKIEWSIVAGLRQIGHQIARRIPATQLDHRVPLQQELKRNPGGQIVAEARQFSAVIKLRAE